MNTFFAKDFADREIESLTKRVDSFGYIRKVKTMLEILI